VLAGLQAKVSEWIGGARAILAGHAT